MPIDPIKPPAAPLRTRPVPPGAGPASGTAPGAPAAPADDLAPGLRGTTLPAAGKKAGLKAYDAVPADQLSPEGQARFGFVERMLADQPGALPAWRDLLAAGRLTAEGPRDAEGRGLLDAVHALALRSDLAPGIDPGRLLAAVVLDVAGPQAIKQGQVATCAATSVQIMLARENPAEYVRILSGLAGAGDGAVALPSGARMRRVPGSETNAEVRVEGAPDGYLPDNRFISERLFQAAAMQLGIGDEARYEPREDAPIGPDGERGTSGLFNPQVARLANATGLARGGRSVEAAQADPAVVEAQARIAELEARYDQQRAQTTAMQAEFDRLMRLRDERRAEGNDAEVDRLRPRLNELSDALERRYATTIAASNDYDAAIAARNQAERAARPKIAAAVAAEVAAGRDALVAIETPTGGHEIVVRRIDDREVAFDNPQSGPQVMPRAEFDRLVRGFVAR